MIQEYIKRPLADELLFGKLKAGGTVRVVLEEVKGERGLGFEYIEPEVKSKKPPKPKGGGTPKARKKSARGPARSTTAKKGGGRKGKGSGKAGSSPVPKVPLPAR